MTHAVKVKKPEEVDGDFRKARGDRDHLSQKHAALVAAGADAVNKGDSNETYRLGRELRSLGPAFYGAQTKAAEAEKTAVETARAALYADVAYRRIVAVAAEEMAARLGPWAELAAVISEAGSSGFAITPLPPSISAEIDEARWWLKEQAHRGVLAVKDLPAGLASLIGGGNHA